MRRNDAQSALGRRPSGESRRKGPIAEMRITAIEIERRGDALRYSANVGGRELYFQLDDPTASPVENAADSFLLMALGPAMYAGTPIVVERDPVSPVLLENLDRAQDVYRAWDRRFRRVPVHTPTAPAAASTNTEVMATYSGGALAVQSVDARRDDHQRADDRRLRHGAE